MLFPVALLTSQAGFCSIDCMYFPLRVSLCETTPTTVDHYRSWRMSGTLCCESLGGGEKCFDFLVAFFFFFSRAGSYVGALKVIARVRELVAGIWEEAKVEMYGSCYTGEKRSIVITGGGGTVFSE